MKPRHLIFAGLALLGLAFGIALYAAAFEPLEQGIDSRGAHIATVLIMFGVVVLIAGGAWHDRET